MTDSPIRNASRRQPPRPVEDREKSFPALSMAYRIFVQNEIWCVEGGGPEVDAYCGMFKWGQQGPRPPDDSVVNFQTLLQAGTTGNEAAKDTLQRMVGYIFKECQTGGTTKINDPDPHRKCPSLTWLYRYYVIQGNDTAETESVAKLKDGVVKDLSDSHLIW